MLCCVLPATALAGGAPEIPSIGIGAGVSVPASPLAINTASVRFRLQPLTIEPIASFGTGSSTDRYEDTNGETKDITRSTSFDVGAVVRFPVAERGTAELQVIGGVGFGYGSTTDDPEGSDNNTTTNTLGVLASWGLGVEWFLSDHFAVSADATNPLIGFSSSTTMPESGDITLATSTFGLDIGFDPTVRVMGHVYF